MKKINKKTIIIVSIVIILIAIIIATTFIIINKNKKKEQEYKELMKSVARDLYLNEVLAEYHSSYISTIWYNAIFEKRDNYTDKYAYIDEYGYGINMWVSFQEAINNYLLDNKELLEDLKDKEKEIGIKLNELQNTPNSEYQKYLDILTEMYSIHSNMVSLANTPTGAYKEYGEKCNEYSEDFEAEYKKLLVLMPDIEITETNLLNEN